MIARNKVKQRNHRTFLSHLERLLVMELQLSPSAQAILDQEMALGYGSPSEVIEQALRLLHTANQTKLDGLRSVLIAAEQSGEAEDFDLDVDLDILEQEALAELADGNMEISPCVIPQPSA
jgi:putative addiction module CopG family antidote